jgi:hypothetical protein
VRSLTTTHTLLLYNEQGTIMTQEFESNPSVEAKIKPNHALQEPPLFKVIYINGFRCRYIM